MEIDTNTYIYITIFVIVLVIISIIYSSFMSRSSDKKQDETKTLKTISQNDLTGLSNVYLNQTGGISGQSTSTSSGPKEFKIKSLNTAELIN